MATATTASILGESVKNLGFWITLKFPIGFNGAYGYCFQCGTASSHGFLGQEELGHCGKCNYSLKRVGEIYIII